MPPLKIIAVNDRRQLRGRNNRLAAPLLFAAMGITLGTLTGLAVAILGTPAGAHGIPVVFANADSTGPVSDTAYVPTHQAGATALAHALDAGKCATDANHPVAHKAATLAAAEFRPVNMVRSTRSRFTFGKASASKKDPIIRNTNTKRHSVRHVHHAQVKPALIAAANDSLSGPSQLVEEDQQLKLNGQAKPSNFYIEGDLEVVDYNANAGTIETSDGRTFIVGVTVAAGDATPWGEYHSNLHYRCSRAGSCALSRAGAFAPNARLI